MWVISEKVSIPLDIASYMSWKYKAAIVSDPFTQIGLRFRRAVKESRLPCILHALRVEYEEFHGIRFIK